MVMTKSDAVKYILANMKESDARQLFRQSLTLTTLSQLAVGLPREENKILCSLLGKDFYDLIIREVEENLDAMSDFGFLAAVGEVISIFEQMQSGGFIDFNFPEQDTKDEREKNIRCSRSWLDMARSFF